jgi:hypothetical protein
MATEQVSTADVARFVKQLNADEDRVVEKILVRQMTPQHYVCQVWFTGEREPEGFGIYLTE